MTIPRKKMFKICIEVMTKATEEARQKWRLYDSPLKTPEQIAALEQKYKDRVDTLQWLEENFWGLKDDL